MRIAREKGLLSLEVVDLRDFSPDRKVDDYAYGGGPGMIMEVGPIFSAVEQVRQADSRLILLTPQGRGYDQGLAKELASKRHLILTCGRYKGVDERARELLKPEEISLGDFVLAGGEVGALAIVESVARLIPGVLGDIRSAEENSFHAGILEGPFYTRPEVFQGQKVPEVLLSGDHEKVRLWRRKESLRRTLLRRPDLLKQSQLSEEDRQLLQEIKGDSVNGS